MHIRCPHCHNAVEVVDTDDLVTVSCPSCGSAFDLLAETESFWLTKRSIGHFELLEQLGAGGFGTVWKAHDMQLDRFVAVKIPRRDQFDRGNVDLFLREARAAAQLRHPHIVAVHEVGREDGTLYIVSDYVQGATIADRLTAGPLTPRETAELLIQVAAALHHAHESGVIHRDLKPQNVIVDGRGQAHLMDFGLAKREAGEVSMTIDGKILGTIAYMSPEQARGESHYVDRRSDIYSLGVILFELLTGERPFRGNHRMLLHQVMHDDPPSPCKLSNQVPRDLETICLKCLEKNPENRYSTAAAVGEELTRWLEQRPILARPISRLERSWRWCGRNPIVAGLSMAIFVTLIVGTTVSTRFALKAEAEAARARNKAQEAVNSSKLERTQRNRADAEAKRAQRHLYIARMNHVQSAWENARLDQAHILLNLYRTPTAFSDGSSVDFRGFEWFYWNRWCHSERFALRERSYATSAALNRSGLRLASGHFDGTVRVLDLTTGKALSLTGHADQVVSVTFSSDEKRLASTSGDYPGRTPPPGKTYEIKIWDTVGGQELVTLKGHIKQTNSLAFSSDGQRLASASNDNTVKVWDTATGEESLTLIGHAVPVLSVAFSPDGKRIVSAGGDFTGRLGEIKVWDALTGQEQQTLEGHDAAVVSVVFSPDGKRLATASRDNTAKIWNASSGQVTLTLYGHAREVRTVAFDSNGERLVSGSGDETIKIWNSTTGQETLTLKGHTAPVEYVAFSPGGKRLFSMGRVEGIKIWEPISEQGSLTLKGHTASVNGVAFSPDGSRVASASRDATVKVWDTVNGQQLLTLEGHTVPLWSVAFSPDGKLLASVGGEMVRSNTREVKVWDAFTGQEVLKIEGHDAAVLGVAFSPDGQRLATASYDQTVKLWNVSTGQELLTLKGHTGLVWAAVFSPDGKHIASASNDKTVKVWDALTGDEALTLREHSNYVTSVAFSRDGKRLASSSLDLTVKVWDVATGQEMLNFMGNQGFIRSVAFSPDGQRLASGGDDHVLKVWDTDTGQEVLMLKGHASGLRCVVFDREGKRLASASLDNTVKLWDATPRDQRLRSEREVK